MAIFICWDIAPHHPAHHPSVFIWSQFVHISLFDYMAVHCKPRADCLVLPNPFTVHSGAFRPNALTQSTWKGWVNMGECGGWMVTVMPIMILQSDDNSEQKKQWIESHLILKSRLEIMALMNASAVTAVTSRMSSKEGSIRSFLLLVLSLFVPFLSSPISAV